MARGPASDGRFGAAGSGRNSKTSAKGAPSWKPRPLLWARQIPPPARPTRDGSVAVMAKYMAPAASAAEPPLPIPSRPMVAAGGSSPADRKSVVEGKGVVVGVDLGGCRT